MTAATRRATIVVLCWNKWALTERCLATLHETTDLTTAEVLVVDNGSTDETPAQLAKLPWLRVVTNATNLGFVRGNNAGIAAADPETDIVLLNNDVELPKAGWLDELRKTADSAADVGVVGARLVLPDGRLLHAGTYVLPDTCWGQQIGSLEKDVNQFARDREVEGIVFACAYLKRELVTKIGGLSTEYESYFEDTDYCLRAKEAGYRTLVAGAVTLVHHEHGSTADTPELFDRIFAKSRETFRSRWKGKLDARYRHEISWQSIMNAATGYAMSCRELLRGLDQEGVRVSYGYIYGPGTPWPFPEGPHAGDYLLDTIRKRGLPRKPDVSVVYGQGDVFHRNVGRYKVGYTMLEVDGFPKDWVAEANAMDEVWVPTKFNLDGFRRSGVTKPIHVKPLAVDVDHFHPAIASRKNPHGDYVFLSNFEWGERKQPELLLKVFNQTFRRTDPVVLLCKVMNRNGAISVRREVEALDLSPAGGRIAFLYNREFAYHELGQLYRSADCYVSAGRGEGWDMPLMEAMACGLPTIATDWGAHTEFVHEGIAYPLPVRGTIPAKALCPYYDGWSWADPDPEALERLLVEVFTRPAESRARGAAAAAEMLEKWTWRHAARRVIARLEAIEAGR